MLGNLFFFLVGSLAGSVIVTFLVSANRKEWEIEHNTTQPFDPFEVDDER